MADSDIYVPDEILDDILVRVPTKSLSWFRCVSKHWNRLISNPEFMKSLSNRKIFVPASQFCQTIEKVASGENIIMGYRLVRADSPFQVKQRSVTVAGTANGLVLLVLNFCPFTPASDVVMNLYNPLTRVLKKVPNAPFINKNFAFGFGHVLKTNHGAQLGQNLPGSVFFLIILLANGYLYWSIRKKDHFMILALDIKDMTLSEIEVPYGREQFHRFTLGTIYKWMSLLALFPLRISVNSYEGPWYMEITFQRMPDCDTTFKDAF
uniref:uncharacterized protein LOC122588085 n=1 Tax=Erigeron canadensis TaxID=72917 RepID=UPI001CB97C97|nr:uncharacterized protein LOC122588085 [Erigeron canadensis]